MAEATKILRATDDDARLLAERLLHEARFAALATLEPETGFPLVSRVLIGFCADGTPALLLSRLAPHRQAIEADARISLLVGEPGKGDPLAHARMTLKCHAAIVRRDSADHDRLRTRFLLRHPKSALYIDFPDFAFFRLEPLSASLNGGFGQAFALSAEDLMPRGAEDPAEGFDDMEMIRIVTDQIENGGLPAFAGMKCVGADPLGFDLFDGATLSRIALRTLGMTEYVPRMPFPRQKQRISKI
ncbi:pyridoxamine 5'-phosphate oxidase family protein [Martelella sp. HB161492]|uniref:HugZ family pyridoxamine 5'-phosphate oxidase n=1 Tax=Martelella sp. HB161492 TaxID=2720726 RepID=UPI0015906DB4|nr:pyridoxamine 5'-phosphate oxidase family protein [Martelella sp. HB161492]